MASLLSFIATGEVDGVVLGSSEDEVRAAFGSPSDTSIARDPIILKYNGLEVTLRDGRVELLHVELDQPLPGFLDSDGLTPETTLDALEQRLGNQGISFEPYPQLTFDHDQVAIRSVPGQVVMIISDGNLFAVSSCT
jgi:hypothetical protein